MDKMGGKVVSTLKGLVRITEIKQAGLSKGPALNRGYTCRVFS